MKSNFNYMRLQSVILFLIIVFVALLAVLFSRFQVQDLLLFETTSSTIPSAPPSVSSDDVMSGIILARNITESADYSECDKLSEKGLLAAREMCFVKIAYDTRNKTLCGRVADEKIRERCATVIDEALTEE